MTTAGRLPIAVGATMMMVSAGGATFAQELDEAGSAEALYSISGQVVDAFDGQYVIRSVGGGRTSMRFSGWPSDLAERGPLVGIGDEVTAIGRLDQEVLDGGALDVLGLYVEDRRAYFTLGKPVESMPAVVTPLVMPSGGFTPVESPSSLIGTITSIGEEELVFRTGKTEVIVETAALNYDPYDDIGTEPLNVGDLIMVEGALNRRAAEEPRFRAQSVTSIFVVGAAA